MFQLLHHHAGLCFITPVGRCWLQTRSVIYKTSVSLCAFGAQSNQQHLTGCETIRGTERLLSWCIETQRKKRAEILFRHQMQTEGSHAVKGGGLQVWTKSTRAPPVLGRRYFSFSSFSKPLFALKGCCFAVMGINLFPLLLMHIKKL